MANTKMKFKIFALAFVAALALALLFLVIPHCFSEECRVERQFRNQYPSNSIDHISEDGNAEWGAYYNVWYKRPNDEKMYLSICIQAKNTDTWSCGAE